MPFAALPAFARRGPAWIGRTGLCVAACLASAAGGAGVRELTPEVRARLFAPTASVKLAAPAVTLRLDATDSSGHYKCAYLRAYVNGRGPFVFLLDTGASYSVVSSRVVAAARAPVVFDRGGHRDIVRIARMTIGGVTLDDLWAVRTDDNPGVDGLLGFPAFGASDLLFDFNARRLTISTAPIPLTGAFELPYLAPFNVPTVPVAIGGRTIQTLIDTGDDAFGLELRSAELAGATFVHPPIAAGDVLNGETVQSTSLTTLKEPVVLGPVHADRAVVGINDSLPVGDFGYDMLRQFRFAIDPARGTIRFQPLFSGRRFEIRGDRTPGFGIVLRTGRVSRVVQGSAAERAGMKAGDRIVAIDGRPLGAFGQKRWDALLGLGRPLSVRWERGSSRYEAVLPVVESR
ncbi:MAG TPA: PDZ domain-containing protein [Allosphingosinicella sp.]|nr:PDZ domain-containing protein [Allosphingosinicella sp.]